MQKEAENMESFSSPQSGGSLGGCSGERSQNSPEKNHHNLLSKGSLSPFMAGTVEGDLETSPYKSKFTVLKFSANNAKSKSSKKQLNPFSSPDK
jgi:hypothetical protein